ncbi:amino acid ABC transporter permease [Nocardioides sp. JQ2195]|uniref:amino acid ABC transporter permease n=1 Tax=Nocardioides sp. JQ2195 TaxID=2592334 RepID=UPI00143E8CD0|nr:amino acid ABC transporter permease [Nocardioides sp. JQ2195]QIX27987.1 amino acid ABC transporter permease [Nocardioides sp. JQ2195]
MDALVDNLDLILEAFWTTIQLTVVAAIAALILGTVLGTMRVSPIPPLRWLGAAYVEIIRNTPLTLVFFFMVFVAPQVDILVEFKTSAYVALSVYTAAFVCEAVRSGINSVSTGQAEAARAIGMTFSQSIGTVILPQAMRTIVPPLINIFVALTKNSSVAAGFFVTELFGQGRTLAIENPSEGMWFLAGVAFFYLVITIPAGIAAGHLERKVAIAR